MTPVHRRSCRAIALCGAILASHALFVSRPMSATSESTCEQLRSWARAYEQAPPTFDELTKFDRAHRIAIFNAVSPAARASLAQEHLRRFAQRADLSETQRAFVVEAIALATPALYQRDPAAKQAFRQFWSRADKAFPTREHRRGWFDLGSAGTTPRFSTAANTNDKQRPARPSSNFCECSTDWDDCWIGTCLSASCDWWYGCGPDFEDPCDGFCFGVASTTAVSDARH
jgi:hypothetical protein